MIRKTKEIPTGYARRDIFALAAATAAEEKNDDGYDDPPGVIAAEKIAKTVIHK